MAQSSPAPAAVNADEIRVLLRVVNLEIAEDRLPELAAEFTAQLEFANLLETVLEGAPESDFGPFDPTFPVIELEDQPR